MERELKLRIPGEYLDKVRHAPLLAQSKGAADAPNLLTSTYFDTPGLALHGCRASLRVRDVGNGRLQTLKLEGSAQAALFDRDEFEMPVDSDTPDLRLLRDSIPVDTGGCQRTCRVTSCELL